jgi:hypothetical protein
MLFSLDKMPPRTDLVSRANALLRRVGKPGFPDVEELKRSACSMFVFMYETLRGVHLEGIIRRPAVKADYAANAEIVLNALSEIIDKDLIDISGLQIANVS